MKTPRVLIFSSFLVLILLGAGFAASPSLTNSYSSDGPAEYYKIEDNYSSSTGGINGVLANPAGIARSSTFEIFMGYGEHIKSRPLATFTTSDESFGDIGGSTGANDFFTAGIYYTDDPTDAPTNEFKTRDINVRIDYDHGGGVTDLGVAFNLGDTFAFGVSRKRPASYNIDLNAYIPVTFRTTMDLRGKDFPGGLTITSTGTAQYNDGVNPTYTTNASLYEKFTYNSSAAALSTSINFNNEAVDSREIVLTVGGKAGDFLWGFNAIPISSNIVLDNSLISKVTTSSANMVYYVPDFDPNVPAEAVIWFTDANNLYSREAGYTTYSIVLTPESYVYRGVARGNYSASAMRVDFGLIWQPADFMSMSLVYENIGGASLIYKGRGVFSTVESYISSEDPPDFTIGSKESWAPLTGTPRSVEGAGGFDLPDEFAIELPRKGKFGIAFTKPFFIAIDYEKYFTDFTYSDITFTDVSFVNVGLQSSLFGLPLILRYDSRWLLRPTVRGVKDPGQKEDIDDMLGQFPVLPASNTFGAAIRAWDVEIGGDFTENHASFLSIYEGDILDFMKVLSYDYYVRGDNWDITYTALGEPFYLLSQNAELLQADGSAPEVSFNEVKMNWVYSLKFGYRF